ncbi:MAG TPA: hypothetical protein VK934_04560 [Fimbriimonas sp.]|nr:hypothetical protein [Fimbriimonas sp.]
MVSRLLIYGGPTILGTGLGAMVGAMAASMGEPFGSVADYYGQFWLVGSRAALLFVFLGWFVSLTIDNTEALSWPLLRFALRAQVATGVACMIEAPLSLISSFSDPNLTIEEVFQIPGWYSHPIVTTLGHDLVALALLLGGQFLALLVVALAVGAALEGLWRLARRSRT